MVTCSLSPREAFTSQACYQYLSICRITLPTHAEVSYQELTHMSTLL